jgi:hypothetical protein
MQYVNDWTWVFGSWSCGLAVCSVRDEMRFQSDAITPELLAAYDAKVDKSFSPESDEVSAFCGKNCKEDVQGLPFPWAGLHELDIVVLVVRAGFCDHVLDALFFQRFLYMVSALHLIDSDELPVSFQVAVPSSKDCIFQTKARTRPLWRHRERILRLM